MKVYYSAEDAKGKIKKSVVTTGSFDGVHVGHKVIIDRMNTLAREMNGESTLVTFHPHPRKVLYPEQKDLLLINSQKEKIELLSKTGLDNLVILPFSKEFAKTSSHDFITDILVANLNAVVIIVGQNHHFGHNRAGDFSYLTTLSEEMGFKVEDIPLKDIENETVSSTKIRKALLEGNIMRANAYLDHQYIICGSLQSCAPSYVNEGKIVWEIMIDEEEKLVPPPGIYATNILIGKIFIKSMSIITGKDQRGRKVENILVYDDVIKNPDELACVYFYKKIEDDIEFVEGVPTARNIRDAMEDVEELIY